MIDKKLTMEQIRSAGIEALRRELGVVGMVRFLQLFEAGSGNYTAERNQWQDQTSLEEIYARIQTNRQEKPQ